MTDDEPEMTRRNYVKGVAAAVFGAGAGGTTREDTSSGQEHEEIRQEFEQYVDEASRERLWNALSFDPDFDTVETRPASGATQLVTYDDDDTGKVSHVIGSVTGYDQDEQAYISSKADEIGRLYKDNPDLYAETGVSPDDEPVRRVSQDENDLSDGYVTEIDNEIRNNLDDDTRNRLWQYFSALPGADTVTVQETDTGYQLTIEDEKQDRDPAIVFGIDEATQFSADEQEYIKDNIEDLHALYQTDQSRYLDETDR